MLTYQGQDVNEGLTSDDLLAGFALLASVWLSLSKRWGTLLGWTTSIVSNLGSDSFGMSDEYAGQLPEDIVNIAMSSQFKVFLMYANTALRAALLQ